MQAPHYTEIINAVNRMNRGITFRDGYGFLGQDVYCLKYTVDHKITLCDDARLAVFPDGVQLLPKNIMQFHRLDGRKKKKFKFADYGCVEDLATDFSGYILATVDRYDKPAGVVKQLLDRQNRKVVKLLRQAAQCKP